MSKKNVVVVNNESPVVEVTKENIVKLVNNIIDNYEHTSSRDDENYVEIYRDYVTQVNSSVYDYNKNKHIPFNEHCGNILNTYKENLIKSGYVNKYNDKYNDKSLYLLDKFNIHFRKEPSISFNLKREEISGVYEHKVWMLVNKKINYTFEFYKEPFDFTLQYGQYSFIFSYQEVLGFYERYNNRLNEINNAKLNAEIQQRFTKYNVN
jgi:hypothetical protein